MERQCGRSLVNDRGLGERISAGSKAIGKLLTRQSCFNPSVGGADIGFTGKGDRVVEETWIAEEHSGGEPPVAISVRMRITSRSSDAERTASNGCDVVRLHCVTAG